MFYTAYIALGSNLGDREKVMRSALDLLRQNKNIEVMQVSNFLENPAVGGPADSPPFLNGAAKLQTQLDPGALLDALLQTEQKLGRHRREKWGPRSIDLDLLLYEDQMIEADGLILPHPLMHQRRFVLQPLAEIAPDAVHPVLGKTIAQMLADV